MAYDLPHRYFPAFRTTENELRGYAYLEDDAKTKALPIVTLTRHRESEDLHPSLYKLLNATGGCPVIVDFDPTPKDPISDDEYEERAEKRRKAKEDKGIVSKPLTDRQIAANERRRQSSREATEAYNAHLRNLLSPMGGYSGWRAFLADAPTVIPIIQLGVQSQSLEQARSFIGDGRMVAFRVDVRKKAAVDDFMACAAGLAQPDRIIAIIDAGYVRADFRNAKSLVTDALSSLKTGLDPRAFDGMVKVCMAGSFPLLLDGMSSPIRILERDLYDNVKIDGWDVRYGDYSSTPHRDLQSTARGWRPHVDVAHPDVWHVERGPTSKAAKDYPILAHKQVSTPIVWNGSVPCWGAQTIELASKGRTTDIYGLEMTLPGRWMSVRISQHISQQILLP